MSEHLSKETFEAHIGPIREDIAEIIKLQREQNGRVGKAETRLAVLEERTPPSRTETNTVSGIVSAVVSAAVQGIGLLLSSQK